jgi:uncharacterized membrane protein YhhN
MFYLILLLASVTNIVGQIYNLGFLVDVISKMFICPSLLGIYLQETNSKTRINTVILGLLACFLADIALAVKTGHDLMIFEGIGVISFFLAHIFYTIANTRETKHISLKIFLIVAILGILFASVIMGFFNLVFPIYTLISLYLFASLFDVTTKTLIGKFWGTFGVLLFLASDTIIALTHFPLTGSVIRESLMTSIFIMTSYIVSQFIIIKSYIHVGRIHNNYFQ